MLSPTSLQAFSSTAGVAQAGRSAAAGGVRPVRAQPDAAAPARSAGPASGAIPGAIPEVRPGVPPPRGSLLNLSV